MSNQGMNMKTILELKQLNQAKLYKLEAKLLSRRSEKETDQLKKELLLARMKVKDLQAKTILKRIKQKG